MSSTCAFRVWTWPESNILLDCANGATYEVAPEIFRRLGAAVTVLADQPDGRNINAGCGSTHIQALDERMRRGLRLARLRLRRRRRPRARGRSDGRSSTGTSCWRWRRSTCATQVGSAGNGVAVTVMTNFGFHAAMARGRHRGGDHQRSATATCSRSCASAAGRSAASSPGHIIELGFDRSGDGIASALLDARGACRRDLSDRDAMEQAAPETVNVRVRDRGRSTAMRRPCRRCSSRRGGAGPAVAGCWFAPAGPSRWSG